MLLTCSFAFRTGVANTELEVHGLTFEKVLIKLRNVFFNYN